MSRGKGSDFEMIERESILRVRNKNQAKAGKKLRFDTKKKGKKKGKKDEREKEERKKTNRLREGKIKI